MSTYRSFLKGLRTFQADQSGGIAIYAAIVIVVILGFTALVLDVGHLYAVKSELQKAADAGALAGARAINIPPSCPNFVNGQVAATAATKANKTDGNLIANCQVQVGYWDLTWKPATAPADLKPSGSAPGPTDVAATKVTVSKSAGNNGGPVAMWFAKLLGFNTTSVSASAVGVILPGNPVDSIPAGDAFPLATPIYWVNKMWKADQDSDSFRIGSDYHYDDGGQWTSFLVDANDVPTIRELIDSGNPGPLKVGDNIYIEPGTKDTLFVDAQARIGDTVLLPIVADDYLTHDWTPVLAFVPFYIEDAVGGSGKYIQGHFVPSYTAPGSTGAPGVGSYGAVGYNAKLVE